MVSAGPFQRAETAPGGAVLRLGRVTKTFGTTRALDELSLTVPENAYVSLLGSSGSSKTVLLRSIAGFDAVDSGSILLRGMRVDGCRPIAAASASCSRPLPCFTARRLREYRLRAAPRGGRRSRRRHDGRQGARDGRPRRPRRARAAGRHGDLGSIDPGAPAPSSNVTRERKAPSNG